MARCGEVRNHSAAKAVCPLNFPRTPRSRKHSLHFLPTGADGRLSQKFEGDPYIWLPARSELGSSLRATLSLLVSFLLVLVLDWPRVAEARLVAPRFQPDPTVWSTLIMNHFLAVSTELYTVIQTFRCKPSAEAPHRAWYASKDDLDI